MEELKSLLKDMYPNIDFDKEEALYDDGVIDSVDVVSIIAKLEEAFDEMSDGEYTKEPIQYSGMYCYLKHLGVDSIIENEEELKKLIIQDKEQARKK